MVKPSVLRSSRWLGPPTFMKSNGVPLRPDAHVMIDVQSISALHHEPTTFERERQFDLMFFRRGARRRGEWLEIKTRDFVLVIERQCHVRPAALTMRWKNHPAWNRFWFIQFLYFANLLG